MGSSDNNRLELTAWEGLIYTKTSIKPYILVEIGSHNGHDSKRLADYFNISYKNIYVIEAHPRFKNNIQKTYPEFNTFWFAASNKNGETIFHAAKNDDDGRSSFLDREIYDPNIFDDIKVPTLRMDSFLDSISFTNEIDLLKIDVEGTTFDVLEGFGKKLKCIKSLQVEAEYFQLWKNEKIWKSVYELLMLNNFKLLWRLNVSGIQDDSVWVRKDCLV